MYMINCRNCEYFMECTKWRFNSILAPLCVGYTPKEKKLITTKVEFKYPQTFEFDEYVKTHNCRNCNREFCDHKFCGQQSFHTCVNWEKKKCEHTVVKCEMAYTAKDVITTVCEMCGETVEFKRVS